MWPVFLLLLASAVKTNPVAPNNENPAEVRQDTTADYLIGDPWFCLEKAKLKGRDMEIFEVLPGFGWDNLRNMDEGQVVSFNYSKCRTTDDGLFLIPDSVSATPVKSSQVQYFAELMEHWKSWTSTNSKSINIDAGFSRKLVTISGKFSYEFTNIKSKQMNDKSATIRTQLRYIRYSVKLQPDTPLHPAFKKRVEHIAYASLFESQEQANFLSELLVRDFGTHVVTKADAGAALIQVQQVSEEWLQEQSNSGRKGEVMASASAHFLKLLNMSAAVTFKEKTSEEFVSNYTRSITSSSVFTEGGPPFLPSDFTARNWSESLDKNLVALDRSGNPLHYLLTEETLPGMPPSVLRNVYDRIQDAVRHYYAYNRVPGCLDPTSPKYFPAANMDDYSSCKNPTSNLHFGGVYQKCTMDNNHNENGDICEKLHQVNPSTGDVTCPKGYFPVKLHSGNTSTTSTKSKCTNYWVYSSCTDKIYESRAKYEMYWCFAQANTSERSEYLFGGLYTTKVDNSITGSPSCPSAFFPLNIGDQAHLSVCISNDKDLGKGQEVPLGGFYSCEVGNPFAADNKDQLNVYYNKSSEWPKRCPPGFSAHLASVDQGCQITYCVTTGSLPGPALPLIKRPPFTPEPPLLIHPSASKFNFTLSHDTWQRIN